MTKQNSDAHATSSMAVATDESLATTPELAVASRRIGRRRLIVRRFLRNRLALVGSCGILVLVLVAIIGPFFLPWAYDAVDSRAFLAPPSASHWLGTTQVGRDVLAMTVHGMSRSLIIGFLVAIMQTAISCAMGATAAYFGKWTERTIMWVIDLFQIIPSFLVIAVLMKGHSNPSNSWILMALLLAAWGWMMTARVVRSLTLSLKQREYILAARYMGLSPVKIIIRHILPNISSLLIVDLTLGVGYAILAETGLSFLGFGIMAPDTSLGTIISEGSRLASSYPWIFATPAIILVFLVMCVNAIGDGLRDALDPNSQSGGRA
ncbi:MAG: ABC transporter permease [Propionibacteriaceae bacterium]|jgi:peptide/nickel transport system permease protein|nr:ABC transporter permease [Propionibacteriaceae bacterium]